MKENKKHPYKKRRKIKGIHNLAGVSLLILAPIAHTVRDIPYITKDWGVSILLIGIYFGFHSLAKFMDDNPPKKK